MKIEDCELRLLAEEDLGQALMWRNSDRVRLKMISHHRISPDEHLAWFKKLQGDPSQAHFVFEYLEYLAAPHSYHSY